MSLPSKETYLEGIKPVTNKYDIDDECPICREPMEYPVQTTCASPHRFCYNCLLSWMESANTCPTCRAPQYEDAGGEDESPVLPSVHADFENSLSNFADFVGLQTTINWLSRRLQLPSDFSDHEIRSYLETICWPRNMQQVTLHHRVYIQFEGFLFSMAWALHECAVAERDVPMSSELWNAVVDVLVMSMAETLLHHYEREMDARDLMTALLMNWSAVRLSMGDDRHSRSDPSWKQTDQILTQAVSEEDSINRRKHEVFATVIMHAQRMLILINEGEAQDVQANE